MVLLANEKKEIKNDKKNKNCSKKKENAFQIDVGLIAYDKRSFSKTAGMLLGGTCSRTVKSWLLRKPNNSLYYCI